MDVVHMLLYLLRHYFAESVILFQFPWSFMEDSYTLRLIVHKYQT